LRFPPFGGLAEVSGAGAAVDAVAAALADAAPAVEVLGPDHHAATARALVRAPDPAALADSLARAVPPARALGRLHIEVDPTRI
jgi:hypothetical protein